MPKKGTSRKISKIRNKSSKRKTFQKGGVNIHYIISSHGSIEGVKKKLTINIQIETYLHMLNMVSN